MSLRLFSLYDSAVGVFMRPFWSDHKANALRSLSQLVNDKSDSNNMVANHPDQFTLFELGVWDDVTGEFVNNVPALSLGNCLEFVTVQFNNTTGIRDAHPQEYRPDLHRASGT